MSQTAGQIIVLNGPPRSGKSSIAAAIQETFSGVWMNLGVDHFMAMTPPHLQPGIGLRPGGERPDLEPFLPLLYAALYESIAAHSRLGLHVVVDVGHHDDYSTPLGILRACARRLLGLPVLFVGIHCPIDVNMARRLATGWNAGWSPGDPIPAPVLRWQRAVHAPGIYDLELDTSLHSPAQCAELIQGRLRQGTTTACQQLAALTGEAGSQARETRDPSL
jgi:chloramphenicol 3-O phosphotransferase